MATLQTRLENLATDIATEIKETRVLVNNNAGDLSALTTTAKANLVAALNELQSEIESLSAASGAQINDASTTSTTETYSVAKIQDVITDAIDALVTGAPGTMDTLNELAAALGDDPNFATTITTALANRVRTDTAAQGLDATAKSNARTNIDAVGTGAIGNPDTDLVAVFQAGLL